ncbi:epiplakin [Eudromia elegans]
MQLLEWITAAEEALSLREQEPLPEDTEQLEELQAQHAVFMEELNRKQPDVEHVTKSSKQKLPAELAPPAPRRLAARRRSTGKAPGTAAAPLGGPEPHTPLVAQLLHRWQQLWLLALDRQYRLETALQRLRELEEFAHFDFGVWRKRYMQWIGQMKSRVLDVFRGIDRDQDGRISQREFIESVLASSERSAEFPTNVLEMKAVASIFDLNGDGFIDYCEFVSALHPSRDPLRRTADADRIQDEVNRQVAQCNCAKRFQVEQISANRYRFGESQQLRMVRILRSTLMVRVGGGWIALDEFLVKNDPCRVKGRTNLKINEKYLSPDALGAAAAKCAGNQSAPSSKVLSPSRSSSSLSLYSSASAPSSPLARKTVLRRTRSGDRCPRVRSALPPDGAELQHPAPRESPEPTPPGVRAGQSGSVGARTMVPVGPQCQWDRDAADTMGPPGPRYQWDYGAAGPRCCQDHSTSGTMVLLDHGATRTTVPVGPWCQWDHAAALQDSAGRQWSRHAQHSEVGMEGNIVVNGHSGPTTCHQDSPGASASRQDDMTCKQNPAVGKEVPDMGMASRPLTGARSIAGAYVEASKRTMTFYDCTREHLLGLDPALCLLEAQAATGSISDPVRSRQVSVTEAVRLGLVGLELKERLLAAEKAATGFVDPYTEEKIPLYQAMQKDLIGREQGTRLLEAQIATGGIIDPGTGHRLPAEVACERGYLDEEMLQLLSDPSNEDSKGFLDPSTTEKVTYLELVKRCVTDPASGCLLLPLKITFPARRGRVSSRELLDSGIISSNMFRDLEEGRVSVQEVAEDDSVQQFLHGTRSVAGVVLPSGERKSLYQALREHLLVPGAALMLLQVQASTGSLTDPIMNKSFLVDEAVKTGLIGPELYEKLSSAERSITGYKDPCTGEMLSLFQAIRKGFVPRDHGICLLEAQMATGGIIAPGRHLRVPTDTACKRGYLDEATRQLLSSPNDDTRGFFDPSSQEKLTYTELLKRCVTDPDTGLLLLPLPRDGGEEPKENHLFIDHRTQTALESTKVPIASGKFKGKSVSLWKLLFSDYMPRERRLALTQQYCTGALSTQELAKTVSATVEETASTANVTFEGLRDRVTADQLLSSGIINKDLFKKLKEGETSAKEVVSMDTVKKYLEGTGSIGGLLLPDSQEKISIYQAKRKGLLRPGTSLILLEAQAATGFIIDPAANKRYSVDEALRANVIGPDVYDKLLTAEKSVTGYRDPYSGNKISLFQAMKKEFIVKEHAIRLLEAQIATGGIIDPVNSHRIPVEVAYKRGYFDRKINLILSDPSDDTKGFFDPNTHENLTYLQLKEKCIIEPSTGLCLLPLNSKKHQFIDEATKRAFGNSWMRVRFGRLRGERVSVWDLLNSEYFSEGRRREIFNHYQLRKLTLEQIRILLEEEVKKWAPIRFPAMRGSVNAYHLMETGVIDRALLEKVLEGSVTPEEVLRMDSVRKYLYGSGSIGGIVLQPSNQRISIYEAMKQNLMMPGIALPLLEAQAATGFIIDPVKNQKLCVDDAVKEGIIGPEVHEKLQHAEGAVTGYKDPFTGKKIPLFQAMKKGLITDKQALQLMEVQMATGGLIDPTCGHYIPVEFAQERGCLDEDTSKALSKPSDNIRAFCLPDSKEAVTYAELIEHCQKDETSGFHLLPLPQRAVPIYTDEQIQQLFKETMVKEKGLSLWELIHSGYFTEEQRSDFVEKYRSKEMSLEQLVALVLKLVREMEMKAHTHITLEGLRGSVPAVWLLDAGIITEKTFEELVQGISTPEEVSATASVRRYLQGTGNIAGVFIQVSKKKMSFYDAMKNNLLLPGVALRLLEAQAATGYLTDPATNQKLSVKDAVQAAVVGEELTEKLLLAERAVTGYRDPYTGSSISVCQALRKELIPMGEALPLLEAQLAAGGIIDPVHHHHLPLQAAYRYGFYDEDLNRTLSQFNDSTRIFFDPNTKENVTYQQLKDRCIPEAETGLWLLPLSEDALFCVDEQTMEVLKSVTVCVNVGRFKGQTVSVWDLLNSEYISDSKRRELVQKYKDENTEVLQEIITIVTTIIKETETQGKKFAFKGLRKRVSASDLFQSHLIDKKTLDELNQGKKTVKEVTEMDSVRRYLEGVNFIAGVLIQPSNEKMGIYQAMRKGILRPGTALVLLEAQAATGFIIDPEKNKKFSVEEALASGLIGTEIFEKLLCAERAVTGYTDPYTKAPMSLFEAMNQGLIVKSHGIRLLEAQIATGGIIDPVHSHRVPVEVAYQRGYFNKEMNQILSDPTDDTKGFFDPNTHENLTYMQLLERCVQDSETGLYMLQVVQEGGRYFYIDESTKQFLRSKTVNVKVGKFKDQTVSVWEILCSHYISEQKRKDLVKQYKYKTLTLEDLIALILKIIEDTEQRTAALKVKGLREDVSISELFNAEILDKKTVDQLQEGSLTLESLTKMDNVTRYLDGTGCIAGILLPLRKEKMSIYQALERRLLTEQCALGLLEAQAATGFLIDPLKNKKLSVDDAISTGLVGRELHEKLQLAERAVTGYTDPSTGKKISLFQAIREKITTKEHGIHLLEAQIATGGIIDPVHSHRVPVEVAYRRGYLDEDMFLLVSDADHGSKGFIDPNTNEKMNYSQLLQRCSKDRESGFYLLQVMEKEEDYFYIDECTKNILLCTTVQVPVGKYKGQTLSLWELLCSEYITEEKRKELVKKYKHDSHNILQQIIDTILNIIKEKEEGRSDVWFQGIRQQITASELLSAQIITKETMEKLQEGKETVQEIAQTDSVRRYLEGTGCIGGVLVPSKADPAKMEKMSIYQAMWKGILRPGTALVLLEAQAATGFIIDPIKNRKLSVEEAISSGLVGSELQKKLLCAERAVTGYNDPLTGQKISLFQAMKRELIVKEHGIRLLEAQVATGGIIDPVHSHRVPVEVAYRRGYFDRDMSRVLSDPSDDTKGFFDPNTHENLTYMQLLRRCVPDPHTGLLMLQLADKGSVLHQLSDEARRALQAARTTVSEGLFDGHSVSVWELLFSRYIPEHRRQDVLRKYKAGTLPIPHMITVLTDIVTGTHGHSATATLVTAPPRGEAPALPENGHATGSQWEQERERERELERDREREHERERERERELEGALTSRTVEVSVGTFQGRRVSLWELLFSKYLCEAKRHELLGRLRDGSLTLEQLARLLPTLVEETAHKMSEVKFEGFRRQVSASDLVDSGILDTDTLAHLVQGSKTVQEVTQMDSVKRYLHGTGCIAGVLAPSKADPAKMEKMSIYQAMRKGILRQGTALVLLEAQAATGFVIDPLRNQKLSVDEAVSSGLVGSELHDKLLSAERAVTGYTDPYSGERISLFQAMKRELIVKEHGIRLLEAQVATGGIIDPVHSHRVPVEVAYRRGYFDRDMSRVLSDPSDDTKGFFDPNTHENLTYMQLLRRCVPDPHTGLLMLQLADKGSMLHQLSDEARRALQAARTTVSEGLFDGHSVSVWELLFSRYIPEHRRQDVLRKYKAGTLPIPHMITVLTDIVTGTHGHSATATLVTAPPRGEAPALPENGHATGSQWEQERERERELERDREREHERERERERELEGALTSRTVEVSVGTFQGRRVSLWELLFSKYLCEAKRHELLGRLRDGSLTLEQLARLLPTLVEETAHKMSEVKFEGFRRQVSASDLVDSGILDTDTLAHLVQGSKTVQEVTQMDSVKRYLHGTGCIAGVLAPSKADPAKMEKMSIYQAMRKGILRQGTALVLLEAQAATGFVIDPLRNQKLSVDEAVSSGLVGSELHDKLLSAERAVTGYTDPYSGERISLFQAMKRELIVKEHGIRLLEAQVATGGIIDPVHSHRVPVEVAYRRGYFDRDMSRVLSDPSDDTKGFFDPNTHENLTYMQLLRRCVPDPHTGLLMLQLADKGSVLHQLSDEARRALQAARTTVSEGLFDGHSVSVWELLFSRYIPEHRRQDVLRKYKAGTLPIPHMITVLTDIVTGTHGHSATATLVTAPPRGEAPALPENGHATGSQWEQERERERELERDREREHELEKERERERERELEGALTSRTVEVSVGTFQGRRVSLWELLFSKYLCEAKRHELLGRLRDGSLTLEQLARLLPTLVEETAHKMSEVKFEGFRRQVSASDLVDSGILDTDTLAHLVQGSKTVQEVTQMDSVKRYLHGTGCIAGVLAPSKADPAKMEKMSIYQAMRKGILRQGTALVLLEAQAATGFVIDPLRNQKLSVDEAVSSGLVGSELHDKLLSAERAVTGYTDPYSGERISLFQAMKRELIVKEHGIRLLEAQVATGGIIDPVHSHRVPVEVAYRRGYFDRDMSRVLSDPSDDTKGFFDPNTHENLTYMQLLRRCVPDPHTGLLMLQLADKGSMLHQLSDEARRALQAARTTVSEGLFDGHSVSVWELLFSRYIPEHRRQDVLRKYKAGTLPIPHMITVLTDIVTGTHGHSATATLVTAPPRGEAPALPENGHATGSQWEQERERERELERDRERKHERERERERELEGALTSRTVEVSVGTFQGRRVSLWELLFSKYLCEAKRHELLGRLRDGSLTLEQLARLLPTLVEETAHKMSEVKFEGFRRQVSASDLVDSGILDTDTLAHLVQGSKTVQEVTQMDSVKRYLHGTGCIAGVLAPSKADPAKMEKMSIYQAMRKGILRQGTALVLLEAQAATGFVIDPLRNQKLSVDEAVSSGLVGSELHDKLLSAERAVTGYTDPYSGERISLFQAMKRELIVKEHGIRLLEAQVATGGIIDPVHSHRVPVEVAYRRGYFDRDMSRVLSDPSDDTKGFFDPNTHENLTYMQLLRRCVPDPHTGLLMLQLADKGSMLHQLSDEARRALQAARTTVSEGLFDGHSVSVWELLFSRYIPEHRRQDVLRKYKAGTLPIPHMITVLTDIVTGTHGHSATATLVTAPPRGEAPALPENGHATGSQWEQERERERELERDREREHERERERERELEGALTSRTVEVSVGTFQGRRVSLWELLFSKYLCEAKRHELLGRLRDGSLTLEQLARLLPTLVEETAHKMSEVKFEGFRRQVSASDLVDSGILDTDTLAHLVQGSKTVQEVTQMDSVKRYLHGTGCIAGVLAPSKADPAKMEKMSIYQAMRKGILRQGTALVLLEAQAATGFVIDPLRNQKLSVDEAVSSGLVGSELHDKLLSAERAVTGYTDPYSGERISLFQAMKRELIVKEHGIRLLEAQVATGGIIDPVHSHRVPVEVAYRRGYFDRDMSRVLSDPSDDTKGFFDPNTHENLTYMQLLRRCVPDPHTGLLMLQLADKGSVLHQLSDEARRALQAARTTVSEGLFDGHSVSVWELLFSRYIPEHRRQDVLRKYKAGTLPIPHMITVLTDIVTGTHGHSATATLVTAPPRGEAPALPENGHATGSQWEQERERERELERDREREHERERERERELEGALTSRTVEVSVGTFQGRRVSLWELLFSKYLCEAKRHELLGRLRDGSLTLEQLARLLPTLVEETAHKMSEVKFEGFRRQVSASDLVDSGILDTDTLAHLVQGSKTVQEVTQMDSVKRYLHGTGCIAGVLAPSKADPAKMEKMSIYQAMRKGILRQGTALVLLEAQAATGFVIDPLRNQKLSVDEAVSSGLVGSELHDKLLSAERAVTGYTDPYSGERISLFQAMKRELIVKEHGIRLLEAQVATGGIIDPVHSHRVPVEVAYRRSYFDRDMSRVLSDPSDDTKGFFDPNTHENLTYMQLLRRCVPDPDTAAHPTCEWRQQEQRLPEPPAQVGRSAEAAAQRQGLALPANTLLPSQERSISRDVAEQEPTVHPQNKTSNMGSDRAASGHEEMGWGPCSFIAGVFIQTKNKKMSIYDAMTRGILTPGTALVLLEAQAASGLLTDPVSSETLSVKEALTAGLIGRDFYEKLLSAEGAVTGYTEPYTGHKISLFQAMKKEFIVKAHAIRLLEAQVATGGIIDPVRGHRIPVEVAYQRGYLDQEMSEFLSNPKNQMRSCFDPNTHENLTYTQLLRRCIPDPDTGLLMLHLMDKGSVLHQLNKEARKALQAARTTVSEGLFEGHSVSVWELLFSRYIPAHRREELLRKYKAGTVVIPEIIAILTTIITSAEMENRDPISATATPSKEVQLEVARDPGSQEHHLKKSLKSAIVCVTAGELKGKKVSLLDLLFSKGIPQEKRQELLGLYRAGVLTVEQVAAVVTAIINKAEAANTAHARSPHKEAIQAEENGEASSAECAERDNVLKSTSTDLPAGEFQGRQVSLWDLLHSKYIPEENRQELLELYRSSVLTLEQMITVVTTVIKKKSSTSQKTQVTEKVSSKDTGKAAEDQHAHSPKQGPWERTLKTTTVDVDVGEFRGHQVTVWDLLHSKYIPKQNREELLELYQAGELTLEQVKSVVSTIVSKAEAARAERSASVSGPEMERSPIADAECSYLQQDKSWEETLRSTTVEMAVDESQDRRVSIWDLLHSRYIPEEKRQELLELYCNGTLTLERLMVVVSTLIKKKDSTSRKMQVTVKASSKDTGKAAEDQHAHSPKQEPWERALKTTTVDMDVGEFRGHQVTVWDLLHSKYIPRQNREELLELYQAGELTLEQVKSVVSTIVSKAEAARAERSASVSGPEMERSPIADAECSYLQQDKSWEETLRSTTVETAVDESQDRRVSIWDLLHSRYIPEEKRQELLELYCNGTLTLERLMVVVSTLIKKKDSTSRKMQVTVKASSKDTGKAAEDQHAHSPKQEPWERALKTTTVDMDVGEFRGHQVTVWDLLHSKYIPRQNREELLELYQAGELTLEQVKSVVSTIVSKAEAARAERSASVSGPEMERSPIADAECSYLQQDKSWEETLRSTTVEMAVDESQDRRVSIWDLLHSRYIPEEKRQELLELYCHGALPMQELLSILCTAVAQGKEESLAALPQRIVDLLQSEGSYITVRPFQEQRVSVWELLSTKQVREYQREARLDSYGAGGLTVNEVTITTTVVTGSRDGTGHGQRH